MLKENCRCPICDTVGEWENVDQYREKPEGMHICKSCGFVFYPEKYMSEDEAKAYYKDDYRKPPQIGNLYTGQRKLHMHSHFLSDLLQKWKDSGKDKPVVCDIGAAYGLFLNWLRSYFPNGEFYGTEYTESYRRNAFHEYQLNLTKDFDKTKKYDLICSYKVAEHQLDVDKRLREYVECLKEDGLIYISVPTWFRKMNNFGLNGFDIEYYYHPDHINVWTRKLFETLLKKVGLEIIKFDDWMYDETYLCKRNDALMDEKGGFEDYKDIISKLDRIKKAWDFYQKGEFEECIKHWPHYFNAWSGLYEKNRQKAHAEGQEKEPFEFIEENYIKPCLKSCPNDLEANRFVIDLFMRYDKYKEAINLIGESLEKKPNNTVFLMALSHCYRQLSLIEKDKNNKIKLLVEARNVCKYIREIDLQATPEVTNWIYNDNAQLPIGG